MSSVKKMKKKARLKCLRPNRTVEKRIVWETKLQGLSERGQ